MESPPDAATDTQAIERASEPYVGQWNTLISTTNWEKGRIIHEWRTTLTEENAQVTEYSDEAWSKRVGAVTPQHVGRLRRVYQRFGQVYEQYPGLYWSHFQAALDWDDAEMWLEGGVQNQWSVSQMRRQRWEALGSDPLQEPNDRQIVTADLDEDVVEIPASEEVPATERRSDSVATGPAPEGPDFGEEEAAGDTGAVVYADESNQDESIHFVRPFENLAELPDDLVEAFEAFKLAILRHKADEWAEVTREDVLASLDALKELVSAAS